MHAHWTERAPRSLTAEYGPDGKPLVTSVDRRWLWWLEGELSLRSRDGLHELRRDLAQYLHETCAHHWRHYPDEEECGGQHWQCLWCDAVAFPG